MKGKLLKVCDMSSGGKYVPGLNVKGEYLSKFGFNKGDMVSLDVSEGHIIITKISPSEPIGRMVDKNPALMDLINEFNLSI